MNHITAVLNRRFHDLSKLAKNKQTSSTVESIGSPQQQQSDGVANQSDLDQSINWCPASEFLKFESNAYSFSVPIYGDANDGQGFEELVQTLTKQLEGHVRQAKLLISSNKKSARFEEDVEELLRVAIGRTQLLLNKRMQQFVDHLNQHLHPVAGQKPTKLDDLHGLWALIDMQLEDIRNCFDSIEKCRLANWKFEEEQHKNK